MVSNILTRTLCVNDVDLGITWSSNKGSMVPGEAQHTAMPHASRARILGIGMPTIRLAGWPRHSRGLSHAYLGA